MTRKRILYILIAGLILAASYAYWASPRQKTISEIGMGEGNVQGRLDGRENRKAVDPKRVALNLLEREKRDYQGYRRDIFNYYRPTPKPKKEPVVKPPPEPIKVEAPKPPPVITPKARQQLARFTFLGFLLKNEERTVFLSRQDELFLVKQGDFFGDENQFEVLDVNPEKLTIRQAGTEGRIEIELVEEEPLIPSYSPGATEPERPVPVVGRPPSVPSPGAGVPVDQRRREWFKQSQPGATE